MHHPNNIGMHSVDYILVILMLFFYNMCFIYENLTTVHQRSKVIYLTLQIATVFWQWWYEEAYIIRIYTWHIQRGKQITEMFRNMMTYCGHGDNRPLVGMLKIQMLQNWKLLFSGIKYLRITSFSMSGHRNSNMLYYNLDQSDSRR